MRTTTAAAVLILAALTTAAAAEPCRMGTNMPSGDANPVKPINSGQARVVCSESTLTTRAKDGSQQQMRTWRFELKK